MGEDTIVFLNLGWGMGGGGFTLLFNKDMLMRVDLVVGLLCYLICDLLVNKYNGLNFLFLLIQPVMERVLVDKG